VKIDIPWINTVVRERINQDARPSEFEFLVDGLTPDEEAGRPPLQKRFRSSRPVVTSSSEEFDSCR